MKCFDPKKLPALTTLAKEFAICDRWFSSVPGPTLPNRAFAHAATSLGHVDMNPVAYWSVTTLYEQLDGQKRTSRVYSHDGNTLAFTFRKLFTGGGKFLGSYGDFLADLRATGFRSTASSSRASTTGTTPAITSYYIANDQHPDNNVAEGELLIQEVYQAIRKSRYWEKCLFVITYDEHGGFYDHVPPPRTIPSGLEGAGRHSTSNASAYACPRCSSRRTSPEGTILHDEFEHSSLAATAREILAPGMKPLTERDKRANSFANALSLAQPRDTPRKIAMKVGASDLRRSDVDPNTHGGATLSDQQRNQVLAAYYMDLDQPASRRVIGKNFLVLEHVNTEQKAADTSRTSAKSLGTL